MPREFCLVDAAVKASAAAPNEETADVVGGQVIEEDTNSLDGYK